MIFIGRAGPVPLPQCRSNAGARGPRRRRHRRGARRAEDARERHRRHVAHLRPRRDGGRLPQGRRDGGLGRSRRPQVDPHPHAGSHRGDRSQRPDREHEPRDAVGPRHVLVPSDYRVLRYETTPEQLRAVVRKRTRADVRSKGCRTGDAARPLRPAQRLLAGRGGLRVSPRTRLEPLPRDPGAAALRRDGDRAQRRNRHRLSLTDAVHDAATPRLRSCSRRTPSRRRSSSFAPSPASRPPAGWRRHRGS